MSNSSGTKKKVRPKSKHESLRPEHLSSKHDHRSMSNQLFESIPKEHGPDKLILNTNHSLEMLEQIPTEVVQEKLDDVLAAVKQLDSTCDYARCKTKTALMFQNCTLCKQRFCFKHGLPEVHGCGDAVRRQEREEFLHPTPLKTLRHEAELKKARERMEQKLKDMNLARKPNPPSTKKK
ncbi:DNA-binding protein SMUBP-2 [Pseudolycoriella hygida]|uniref:DNA-binding protein SMUBP-2 n=1 Tax=Pseudolycoriella hygida TaxID=35572 RepID=A0A9Q0S256_9DIPT|nr:DNA-binding protein SMUBP-2 [Pseudolycoriella hygida]